MNLRGTGAWDGVSLINLSKAISGADRAASLEFRIINETMLAEKARQKIIFGWGGYGRSFVFDENGRPISVPDGRWIILLGSNGIFGLTAYNALLLVPALVFFLRCPVREYATPLVIPAAAFSTFLCITMIR